MRFRAKNRKASIEVSDSWFEDGFNNKFGGGRQPSYAYLEDPNNFLMHHYRVNRKIPFGEALAHEMIHASRWIDNIYLGYYEEENYVKNQMNIWREKRNIVKRGLYVKSSYSAQILFRTDPWIEKLYKYDRRDGF